MIPAIPEENDKIDTFTTKSVKIVLKIMKTLFQDMLLEVSHRTEEPVNKFPIDIAGNKEKMDGKIRLDSI